MTKKKACVWAELQAYSLISGYCTSQYKDFMKFFKVIYVCFTHPSPVIGISVKDWAIMNCGHLN